MKIVMVSNFMNHHQLPFSQELWKRADTEYRFVALEPIPQERLAMGYEDMNHRYPHVLCAYDSAETMRQAERLIDGADVAIFGSCPDTMIAGRTEKGKLCIKFCERYFRNGTEFPHTVRNFVSARRHIRPFENSSLYCCCCSAYAAADLNRYADFGGKTFKWGYFPRTVRYDEDALMEKKGFPELDGKRPLSASVLWAGRLVPWKHPETAIELAAFLKDRGYSFRLRMIGNGKLENRLRKMTEEKNLSDCVEMTGAMPPEQVRANMEKADIFLFTSDFREGWGAVLNEAMNSGCAVVASHAAGAVPFLIKDGENGLIYESGNLTQFQSRVCGLLDDPDGRRRIGRNAYRTIAETWNAEVAADRFVALAERLKEGGDAENLFESGPCSRAEIWDDGWYHDYGTKP